MHQNFTRGVSLLVFLISCVVEDQGMFLRDAPEHEKVKICVNKGGGCWLL